MQSTAAVFMACASLALAWTGARAASPGIAETGTAGRARPGCVDGSLIDCSTQVADSLAQACAMLGRELPGRHLGGETVSSVTACEAPLQGKGPVRAWAAVLPLQLALRDGPPSHLGVLMLRSADGWRMVDAVLPLAWTHGGFCSARAVIGSSGSAAAASMSVQAERTCHQPLDAAERKAGAASIVSIECQTSRYLHDGSAWRRVSTVHSSRRCRWP